MNMRTVKNRGAGLAIVIAGVLATGAWSVGSAGASTRVLASGEGVAGLVERGAGDVITFRNGNTVEGEIIEETARTVKIRVTIHGISTVTTYEKSDILVIKRDAGGEEEPERTEEVNGSEMAGRADGENESSAGADAAREGAARVYVVELDGWFGRDISQTPIRKAVEDAYSNDADHLVFVLDNIWKRNEIEERLDQEFANFDMFFRAQALYPIFTRDIPMMWDDPPKVVFWVKQAMGGAAFLPLISKNIYFAPDARMGGIGNLSRILEGVDEVVRQKQISLRINEAIGAASIGGYPAELVRAMAEVERVYSYRIENGEPVIVEGYPNPARGEVLLTDDGEDENTDTIQAVVRGQGNDVLTLSAELARKLGVSDGTVSTIDDLLFALGVARNHVRVDDRADRIMDGWERSLTAAERQLRELAETYQETQVQGDYSERTRARGVQRRTLEKMMSILRRYEEAINPRQLGVPTIAEIRQLIEQIKMQQLADEDD